MSSWQGRLIVRDSALQFPSGSHFIPIQCTAFGILDEKADWLIIKQYIEQRIADRFNSFRAIIGSAWGGAHQGEDGWAWQWGGKQFPLHKQDRTKLNHKLFKHIERVLEYMHSLGAQLQLELTDGSQNLIGWNTTGTNWYLRQDVGWELLCGELGRLSQKHDNLLVTTGNEPGRWVPPADVDRLYMQQNWLASTLKIHGCDLIGGEVTGTTGSWQLGHHEAVQIVNIHAGRSGDIPMSNYNEMLTLRNEFPGKVIWSNEPARLGYPAYMTVEMLRELLYMTAVGGAAYTFHGLGSGAPIWGVSPEDGLFIAPFFRARMNSMQERVSKDVLHFYNQCNGIIDTVDNGRAFAGRRGDWKIIVAKCSGISFVIERLSNVKVFDLFHEKLDQEFKQVEQGKIKIKNLPTLSLIEIRPATAKKVIAE